MPKSSSEQVADFLLDFLPSLLPKPVDSVAKTAVGKFSQQLTKPLKESRLKSELLEAAQKAESNFRTAAKEKFDNDKLTQAVASFPLFDRELFQSALRNLPKHLNEEILSDHLQSYIADDWKGEFTPAELREGMALYLNCLRLQLLKVEGFAELITQLAVLRTDQRSEKILEVVNKPYNYDVALDDYLESLRIYCENLPYLSLNNIYPHKPLGEIYIPIKFISKNEKGRKEKNENQDIAKKDEDKSLLFADILRASEPPHVLIVGEAGAGKSTLLRQTAKFAWHEPEKIGLDKPHLPLLLSLRSLAGFKGKDLEEIIRECLASTGVIVTQALPAGFFTEWPKLKKTKWLLLLDGLDEVPEENNIRAELITFLNNVLKKHDNIRIVITTRSSGYKPDDIDDTQFAQYEILPPSPEQIKKLAEQWFGADAPDFLQAVDRVSGGAFYETPLLITIAAKVYGKRKKENGKGSLPRHKAELYNEVVDILLEEAYPSIKKELGSELADIVRPVLAYLAWEITKNSQLLSEEWLAEKAVEFLKEEFDWGNEVAKRRGLRFVQVIGRRSGILTRREKTYDWLHPTFREYLTACHMVTKDARLLNMEGDDFYFLYSKEWRESTFFAISILASQSKDTTTLVKNFYKSQGVIIAGQALAQSDKVDQSLVEEIIDKLGWQVVRDWVEGEYFKTLEELIYFHPQTKDVFLKLIDNPNLMDFRMRYTAISSLGKAGYADELFALACDTQRFPYLREEAAIALTKIAQQTDKAAQACLSVIHDESLDAWFSSDPDRISDGMKLNIIDALRKSPEHTELGASLLFDFVKNKNYYVHERKESVKILGDMGQFEKLKEIVQDNNLYLKLRMQAVTQILKGEFRQASDILLPFGKDGREEWLINLVHNDKEDLRKRFWAALETIYYEDKRQEYLHELFFQVIEQSIIVARTLANSPEIEPSIREFASEIAEGWSNIIPEMLKFIHDNEKDQNARMKCVELLALAGRIDDLLGISKNKKIDVEVRKAAAIEFATHKLEKNDSSFEIAWKLARSEDLHPDARVYAIFNIYFKILESELESDNWSQMSEVISLFKSLVQNQYISQSFIGILHDPLELLKMANDEKFKLSARIKFAEIAGHFGHLDDSLQILLSFIHNEEIDDLSVGQVIAVLGRIGDSRCLPALEKIANQHQSEDLPNAASQSIVEIHQRGK